jgi:putative DNA primase/helicase
VREALDSAQLASVLTAETWTDRVLGQTRMIELANRCTWVITANNPRLSLEVARRCIRIRMDAKTDRPWDRQGFKHVPLRKWALEHRAELVHAVLVMVQGWLAAGSPSAGKTLGSFEPWAEVIGGILQFAGVPGFLEGADQFYDNADADGQEWREFTVAWWERHGSLWVSSGQLLKLVTQKDLLAHTVGDRTGRSPMIRLGKALSAARDRQFGDFRIAVGQNSSTKAAQYRLQPITSARPAHVSLVPPAPPAEMPQVKLTDLAALDEAWGSVGNDD